MSVLRPEQEAVILEPKHTALSDMNTPSSLTAIDCQSCGACCSYSADWPRFTMESDEAIDLIPEAFISKDQSGMGCDGVRCLALAGEVGRRTTCTIYTVRPEVCRDCLPGDAACIIARQSFGLE